MVKAKLLFQTFFDFFLSKKSRITIGEFTNDSEYLRDLVRQDQAKNAKFSALKAAITEGMESGISNKSVPDIMKAVEERMRADGRL